MGDWSDNLEYEQREYYGHFYDTDEEIHEEETDMSDLISRQAVEDITWEEPSYSDPLNVLTEVREKVRALPSVENKGEWIPVSERLPEEFESVLVCYKSQGGMAQAVSERFGTHTGYKWSALAGIEPIAWMPLPEPYKADMRGET